MTLTAEEIIICNLALGEVGEASITSGMPSNAKQYELCERYYDEVRKEVLSEHVWNEAKTRTILVQEATAPLFGYDYQFAIPDDFVRAVRLGDGDNDWDHWEVENGYLLTNLAQSPIAWAVDIDFVAGQYCTLSDVTYLCNTSHTSAAATSPATDTTTWTTTGGDYSILELEYIYDLTDTSKWSPKLKGCIAQKLAQKVVVGLTNNPKAKADLINEYENLTLRKARSADAQQGRIRPIFKSFWWNSRR
jgi:hypothetical protein